jgi:hypothetical protein
MRSEAAKGFEETEVMRRFVERSQLPIDPATIEKRVPPEPDLICNHAAEGPIAFELVNLCDPELAKVVAAGANARTDAFSTSDPSARIVRSKLAKNYVSAQPIDLLIYADGPLITPDDVIIPTIRPILDSAVSPFRKVWFMGEKCTCLLWQAS